VARYWVVQAVGGFRLSFAAWNWLVSVRRMRQHGVILRPGARMAMQLSVWHPWVCEFGHRILLRLPCSRSKWRLLVTDALVAYLRLIHAAVWS